MDQKVPVKQLPKQLYTKAILMGVALLLLVAALVFFTAAWYTKMVSTAGINLNAARWDFTANHTVDSVTVMVYEYSTTESGRAAPGTGGWIPILLGARQSDTNVHYNLSVDRSTMSEEFQDRIFFYYFDETDTEHLNRIYFGPSPADPDNAEIIVMEGVIQRQQTKEVTIYWEWVYDANSVLTNPTTKQVTDWDEFDTKVGENPEIYMPDMNATIKIVGMEVLPEQETDQS